MKIFPSIEGIEHEAWTYCKILLKNFYVTIDIEMFLVGQVLSFSPFSFVLLFRVDFYWGFIFLEGIQHVGKAQIFLFQFKFFLDVVKLYHEIIISFNHFIDFNVTVDERCRVIPVHVTVLVISLLIKFQQWNLFRKQF